MRATFQGLHLRQWCSVGSILAPISKSCLSFHQQPLVFSVSFRIISFVVFLSEEKIDVLTGMLEPAHRKCLLQALPLLAPHPGLSFIIRVYFIRRIMDSRYGVHYHGLYIT